MFLKKKSFEYKPKGLIRHPIRETKPRPSQQPHLPTNNMLLHAPQISVILTTKIMRQTREVQCLSKSYSFVKKPEAEK